MGPSKAPACVSLISSGRQQSTAKREGSNCPKAGLQNTSLEMQGNSMATSAGLSTCQKAEIGGWGWNPRMGSLLLSQAGAVGCTQL